MCDMAWVVLSDRIREATLAQWTARLSNGEDPPQPEEKVNEFAELLAMAPESDNLSPAERALRRMLGVG